MIKRLLAALLCLMMLLPPAMAEDELTDTQLGTFYDDAIFVGDSVIRMLHNYIKTKQLRDKNFFKGAKFYAAYSYQMRAATYETPRDGKVNLLFRGSQGTLSEIVRTLKPGKLFFLAGLNDNIVFNIDRGMGYAEKIVSIVQKRSPDTKIYFFSMTPVTASVNRKRNGMQAKVDEYNRQLEEKCQELGVVFLDISTQLKGEEGTMMKGISHDGEYHLNDKGNAIWVQQLLNYAREQYESGQWTPAAQ